MNNHDVVRGIRDALAITDEQLAEVLAAGGHSVTPEAVARYEDPHCADVQVMEFLNGLVVWRRGPSPSPPAPAVMSNNVVLKKLRVALELKESDVVHVFSVGGRQVSSRDLTPWFRKPGTKHYRECDDETLAVFLGGLAKLGMPSKSG